MNLAVRPEANACGLPDANVMNAGGGAARDQVAGLERTAESRAAGEGKGEPAERSAFLAALRDRLRPGDHFLLGADLVKAVDVLLPAYDDAAGVTAAFNLNVLDVVNHRLSADFDRSAFAHVAAWDPVGEWIEMRLRSQSDQRVTVRALDLDVDFAAGEEMRTEISAKFRREGVETELASAGLRLDRWMTDPNRDFVAVATGFRASYGVKKDGSIVAWGRCPSPFPSER